MVKTYQFSAALLAFGLSSLSHAHPGEHEMVEAILKRGEHAAIVQRGLQDCFNHPKFLELQRRGQDRRWEKAQQLRRARGIHESTPFKTRRDLAALESFENVEHNMTSLGYTESNSPSVMFASYKNASCILTPEVTYGPYFVTGEYYRTNVTEDQEGIPVHLEYQYIDISTCEVATGLYLEAWQANATGVYSGVVASGNGNDADGTNLDTTFLRGVTQVDEDGVGYFDTIFPGHYSGRATHIHLIAQQNGTVFANGTYSGGTISHVGQLFFDESLKDAVYDTYPYNANTQSYTTNDADMWAPDQADNNYDPIPDYAYLGNDISDGLLMWISVGINMSAEYTVTAAATLTADGGVASDGEVSGSSGSGAMASGSMPSGAMPSGSGSAGSAPSGMSMGAGQSMSMGSAPSDGMGGSPSGSSISGSASVVISGSNTAASVSSSSKVTSAGSSVVVSSASSKTSSSKAVSSAASIKLSTSSVDKAKTVVGSSSSTSLLSSKSTSLSKSSTKSSIKSSSTSNVTTKTSSVKSSTEATSTSTKKSSSASTKKSSAVKLSSSSVKKSSTQKSTSIKKSSAITKSSSSSKKSSVKKPSTSTKKVTSTTHVSAKKSTSTEKASTSTKKVTKKVSSTQKGLSTVTTKTSSKKN
ncbi:aromatic compound dioxygenase [Aureobasidium pullulans]|uniref:Aromatic compound dioxygenase n=1 Tax=Aureobasidium pullulans TaxID=5580 RepID=A0A4S9NNQ4_AURPU|nr:aromatic compound dioxygenase [Aureobasidium pullulans]THW61193.1 aromatic compound dioxygenase [Aureobasidium pullulans]THY58748.1 aromatic compound dioxygenase [Aureobasidium pullulans]THZ91482.1 aromatic compound dioxygenase [Aureobasidium pullulans]